MASLAFAGSNFGLFASAERTLVFDVNDFDETLPAPFDYDVRRLAASVAVAALASRGEGDLAIVGRPGRHEVLGRMCGELGQGPARRRVVRLVRAVHAQHPVGERVVTRQRAEAQQRVQRGPCVQVTTPVLGVVQRQQQIA